MEDWDQETLEKVVEQKNKEYNQNKPTDIVRISLMNHIYFCSNCERSSDNAYNLLQLCSLVKNVFLLFLLQSSCRRNTKITRLHLIAFLPFQIYLMEISGGNIWSG